MNNVPTASILTIGDEVLIGRTIDSNSAWLGSQLSSMGFEIRRHLTVQDKDEEIKYGLKELLAVSDVVITTGGLGPTEDDRTKPALAEFLGKKLIFSEEVWQWVIKYAQQKHIENPEIIRNQAEIIEGSEPLYNPEGSAPGLWIEHNDKVIVALPGVPWEMKAIFKQSVAPRLKEKFNLPEFKIKVIRTIGLPEASVRNKLKDLPNKLPENIQIGFYPSLIEVKIVLRGYDVDEKILEQWHHKIAKILGDIVYSLEDKPLAQVIGEILRQRQQTISTAESCTGGYLAHLITSIPGSSDYYLGTVVSYHNQVKSNLLGVPEEVLETQGAVSKPTVEQMVRGVRQIIGSDWAVATSGIAGPTGGTPEKPVGTVWIATGNNDRLSAIKFHFSGSRLDVITKAALMGLDMLRRMLEDKPMIDPNKIS
ncbi:MAG: competence/damage-inducible protein A [Chlorobi bacterium]|nr:competence/damage-inducible protein A [Chlorobiota bacterium]